MACLSIHLFKSLRSNTLFGIRIGFPRLTSHLQEMSVLEDGKDVSHTSSGRLNHTRPISLKSLHSILVFLVLGLGMCIVSIIMIRYFGMRNRVMTLSMSESCFEERSSLEEWIRPPSDLRHAMNDSELFWRASLSTRITKYPYKRVRKIAFMFLTRGPLPLAPLWERFFRGHEGLYSVYVHSLPDYRSNFSRSSAFYDRDVPSQMVEWGMMSMCDAERRLLANALLDYSNEWFILLSESCIPLLNFTRTYNYLARSHYSFIGSIDELGPYGRGRYDYNMEPEVSIEEWRKGSQWFEVNRELAVMIVEDTTYYPKFKTFCQPHCYVDEHYFPTMLAIEAPNLLGNRSLTFTDWSRGGAHPATFGRADISEALFRRILETHICKYNQKLVTLCYLFARKFAPSSLEPLLDLAPKMFGY